MAERIEKMEFPEQKVNPEQNQQMIENLLENSRAAEAAGNHDMAEYYQEKAKQLENKRAPANEEGKLGGWYAGYTENQWRDKAKEEFIKNGDSLKYREYCDNAIKANN